MSEQDAKANPRRIAYRRRGWVVAVLALLSSLVPMLAAGKASAEVTAEADLHIEVSDVPDPVFTNASLTYHLWVGNAGPSRATAVGVTTQLPSGVRFEPGQSDSICSAAGDLVACSLSFVDASAIGVVSLTVTPTTAGSLQLGFTVIGAEPDPDLSNNSEAETTQVVQPTEADLSIAIPSVVRLYAGESTFYAFSVDNAGPATATGLTVTLEFPLGLRLGTPASCVDSATGVTCTLAFGDLPADRGYGVPVLLTASAAGSYPVQARVRADQPDPNLLNNVDSGLVEVLPAAYLSVRIAESADPSLPGQPLTYTVTVTNLGPSPAPGVTLVDTWSTTAAGGVELLSFTVTSGQCLVTAAQTIECALGELDSGATATATLRLRPRGPGAVTDQAQVSAELDRNPTNNAASETTTVRPRS